MATTKLHSVHSTEVKALTYIVNPDKTDHGKLIYNFAASNDPVKAAEMFRNIRATGTGRSSVLCEHIIQSFAPGEITSERAMAMAQELCRRLLKDQYQYVIAVHNDHDHIHAHIIFNNTNMVTGRTFETEENQGKKSERSWAKLREQSDNICRENGLSVIENPSESKSRSHFEWDMNRQNISWKEKLRYKLDQVITMSEDFGDFLFRCAENDITLEYKPDRKMDLKFKLEGQQRFVRAKTLGWNYETDQIKKRIALAVAERSASPKIIKTTSDKFQIAPALKAWADRQNMAAVSKVINLMTEHGLSDVGDLESRAHSLFAKRTVLVGKLNNMKPQIDELSEQIKVFETGVKYLEFHKMHKSLTGRKQKKYAEKCRYELDEYHKAVKKAKGWYPDQKIPTVKELKEQRNKLIAERNAMNAEYSSLNSQFKALTEARKTLSAYLENECEVSKQKKKKQVLE